MRRIVALLAAFVLVGSLTASSVAATPGPKTNSFVGNFQLAEEGTWRVLGQVSARLDQPTDRQLVPGTYDSYGAPDNAIREDHAQIGNTQFWYDPNNAPGGTNVAFGEGVHCLYWGPNNTTCQPFAVMFIDNLNPVVPDQVAYANHKDANGDWVFEFWCWVGRGSFKVTFVGPS